MGTHRSQKPARIIALVLAILLIAGVLFFVFAAVSQAASISPTSDFFINDFAGVLKAKTRNEVMTKGAALQNLTGAQAVVVIINSLEGKDRNDYAIEILRSWGIGQKDKNNGVLLLVALDDKQVKLEVGYGLEGALPDGKCGRILDDVFLPNMRDGDTDAAVLAAYDAILIEIAHEYNIDPQSLTEGTQYTVSQANGNTDGISTIITIVIFIVVFGVSSIFRFRRGGRGGWGGFGGGGFGGGSGGGFGGGGGGFSGGGGSGGGGGAGRSW